MKRNTFLLIAFAAPLLAQTPCAEGERGGGDRARHCDMREYTIADTGRLMVDAGQNGGVKIIGSDRSNILVRARVQTQARSQGEADSLASMVRVEATPGSVSSVGPQKQQDQSWSVSFEVLVPRRSGLELKAHNGGIGVKDVEGGITFQTVNGGVQLEGVNGDVRGKTTNGGINVQLTGTTWHGNQLDVVTQNGGIKLKVPENFNARVEAATVNGGVHADFPGANVSKDRDNRNVSVTIGAGGPLVRLVTTNGGIHVDKT